MTDTKAKAAEAANKYSASDANKNNQRENANPPAKKPRETKEDDMGDKS